MIRACLFDLDGVIVDTARYHYIAWKALAYELGFEFTEKDNERLKGVSRMASLDILLEIGGVKLSSEKKEELADRKNQNYRTFILKMKPDELLPGAEDFLKELKSHNILVGMGSGSKNAMTIVERLKLEPLFDVIIDGTQVTHAKPNPEVFLKGAEALHVEPAACVVFEDAAAGVEAALKGGMKCVGIGSPEVLGKAHMVVAGLSEMNYEKLMQLK